MGCGGRSERKREEGGRERKREKEIEIEIGRKLVRYWLMCLIVSYCSCRSEEYSKTLLSPLIQVDGVRAEGGLVKKIRSF